MARKPHTTTEDAIQHIDDVIEATQHHLDERFNTTNQNMESRLGFMYTNLDNKQQIQDARLDSLKSPLTDLTSQMAKQQHTTMASSSVVGEQEAEGNNLSNEISSIGSKKLLVLDLNGLLADIVFPPPYHVKADTIIERRAIFKRPFYEEFLNFCFERFDVAVWSSRTKKNVDSIVDYLFGDMKQKLIFCWDISHCTDTGFKTLENMYKPLVFKDLRKIWLNYYPNLPWERGYYNMSNTLLLDDSPYKALLNHEQNSIFPNTFSYWNQNDNSLAAGGDLRQYLDGLANADNMVDYVEHHPFGREHINGQSESWCFYVWVVYILYLYEPEKVYPSIGM